MQSQQSVTRSPLTCPHGRGVKLILHTMRLLALISVIVSQFVAIFSATTPLHAAPARAVAQTIDVCAAPLAGSPPPTLFMPVVVNEQPSAATSEGSSPNQTSPNQTSPNLTFGLRVAFVHGADTGVAQAFQTLLAEAGVAAALLPVAQVGAADFGKCDLLIIAGDTGDWSDAAARAAVINAHLPLLAQGNGGLNLFEAAGLTGGLARASAPAADIEPLLRGLDAYQFPNEIEGATAATLAIYNAPTTVALLTVPAPLPDGIEIARLPGTQDHPVLQLDGRYLLWGFNGAPEAMTAAGQALFINLLAFQQHELRLPLQSRTFVPARGVDPALLNALAATSLPQLHAYVQYESNAGCPAAGAATTSALTQVQHLFGTTYFATVTKDFGADDFAADPCLRWVGHIRPTDKVTAKVLAGEFEAWAVTDQGIKLLVAFFDDVNDGVAAGILQVYASSFAKYGDHVFRAVVPQAQIAALSSDDRVKWIEEGPPPQEPLNDIVRDLMHVDEVQQATVSVASVNYTGLDGSGVVVGVFDLGFDTAHPDFAGRIIASSGGVDDHGTHVAGILGGSGANSASQGLSDFQLRGMAPNVDLILHNGDIGVDTYSTYINTNGMQLTNYSLKLSACGGVYDGTLQILDDLVRGDTQDSNAQAIPPHTMVAAAGNEGDGGQYCNNATGFHSVFNVAKNSLLVGGLLRNGSNLIADSSARGPAADGRLKPDVMAIYQAQSTVPGGGYGTKNGTSMASPAAAGVGALVLQQYLATYGENPLPSSLRGLLIHHATDLVNEPGTAGYTPLDFWSDPDTGESLIYYQGPEFSTGYGMVNAHRSVAGAAAYNAIENALADDSEVDEFSFAVVTGRSEVKVTLVWDDPGGDPALAATASQLVNDLDLVLIDPAGGMHYPYVLDPLPISDNFTMDDVDPAYQAEDHRNNVEQVVVRADDVPDAAWTGTWTARVLASDVPEGPQSYSLIGEWRTINIMGSYPIDGGYNAEPEAIIVPVRVRNPHLDPAGAAGFTTPDDWEVSFAQSNESLVAGTIQAVWGPVGEQVYLVVRPPDTLAANTPYHMVVYLRHRYQRHQHTTETSQPVAVDLVPDAIVFDDEPRPPVDEMIVGDNSGSMGSYGKLGAAKNAARAFVDRRDPGDQIGVATFADSATTLMNLTEVTAGEIELGNAKVAVNNMTASGDTAMGEGLLEGKGELDANGDAGHTHNIVLLTDGLENIAPCWNTEEGHDNCIGAASVQPDFVSDSGCPAIQIDTVVIGPDDASWVELLADIAGQTCGQPYTVTTEEDEGTVAAAAVPDVMPDAVEAEGDGYFAHQLPNNLTDIYLDIADNNTRQQRLADRGRFFFFSAIDAQAIELEAGLDEVEFVVNWYNESNGVKVSLFRPSGEEVIDPDADAHIRRDNTHIVYIIQNPAAGLWKVEVGSAAPQEYILTASANTPTQLLLTLGLEPDQRIPGAALPIYAVVSDRLGVAKGGTVNLKIRIPGGTIVELPALDDGAGADHAAGDGVFTALYRLPTRGGYQIKAMAEGTNNDGVAFTRFAQHHLWATERPLALYVHDTDAATGEAFKTLLEQQGFAVQLVAMEQILGTDFAAADLTLIGYDTGWGKPEQVRHIGGHAKRIIAIGQGGHAFLGAVGAAIGADPGIKKAVAGVSRWDNTHPIWNTPYDLSTGTPLPIFPGAGGSGLAIHPAAGVEPIAGDEANSTPVWIAREGNQFLYWGFEQGPTSMTVAGRALFGNAAWLMTE